MVMVVFLLLLTKVPRFPSLFFDDKNFNVQTFHSFILFVVVVDKNFGVQTVFILSSFLLLVVDYTKSFDVQTVFILSSFFVVDDNKNFSMQ